MRFIRYGRGGVAWYLRRVLLRDFMQALDDITDGSNDKWIDAVVVDDGEQRIIIIQGKFITASKAVMRGKVFSPQNWQGSSASVAGQQLAAGKVASMLPSLPNSNSLLQSLSAPAEVFTSTWSAE